MHVRIWLKKKKHTAHIIDDNANQNNHNEQHAIASQKLKLYQLYFLTIPFLETYFKNGINIPKRHLYYPS